MSINPENVEKVSKWPVPTSVKEVERFLGFANYHREHIKDYASVTRVLYQLTGSKVVFNWLDEHQEAFELTKQRLISAPILSYPNAEDVFVLDTDASGHAIGAVLSQIQNDCEKVICYGSYVLTPEQRKYCVTRRELLSVVQFTRQFRHYLLGRKFLLRTDNNSLTWLLRFKHIEGQLARWLEELSQFDMVVQHRPGTKHGNADGLSRISDGEEFCDCYRAGIDLVSLPCGGCKFCSRAHHQWSRFQEDVDDVVPLAVRSVYYSDIAAYSWLQGYSHEQISKAQKDDLCVGKIIDWVSKDITPKQCEVSLCGPSVKYFYINRHQLVYQNELLLYKWTDNHSEKLLLVVPDSLKEEIMSLNHDLPLTGHMGIVKTVSRIRNSYIWYKMNEDIELFVKSCSVCNKNKRANVKPRARLGQYHAGSPLERVHIDILGPFTESNRGNQYVLMIVDQFTKWLECFPLPLQSAELTAKAVVDGFISRFGCPLEIHTDQGRNFDGKLFSSVCELLEVTKTRTTPYRPCSNGQVERYNRTLLQLIRCFLKGNQKHWDDHLQQLAGAIRSTVNRSTGFTPNMMMLGREVMLPVDLMIASKDSEHLYPAEYVKKLREVMNQVHTLAREKLVSYQKRQQRDYDLKLKVNTYEVGDLVYVLDTARKVGLSPKLQKVWKGPMLVVEAISSILFRVANRKKSFVLHHDRLKPCEDREIPLWLKRKRNALLNQLDNGEKNETDDFEEGDLERLFDCEYLPVRNEQALNENHFYIEQEDQEFQGNNGNNKRLRDSTDIVSQENQTMAVPETFESSDLEQIVPLPPTRYGRERRRPQHLQDYSL